SRVPLRAIPRDSALSSWAARTKRVRHAGDHRRVLVCADALWAGRDASIARRRVTSLYNTGLIDPWAGRYEYSTRTIARIARRESADDRTLGSGGRRSRSGKHRRTSRVPKARPRLVRRALSSGLELNPSADALSECSDP